MAMGVLIERLEADAARPGSEFGETCSRPSPPRRSGRSSSETFEP